MYCSNSENNPESKRYDVYASFCNEDAHTFVLGIRTALSKAGVTVFWGNKRLPSGKKASLSSLDVIGECRVVIIVFSSNYVNTRRCREELVKITEFCQTSDLIVLPLFYDGVYPSCKIFQKSMFGDAFHKILESLYPSKEEDKLMSWVAIISKATQYSKSMHSKHVPLYRSEMEYMEDIVGRVIRALDRKIKLFTVSTTSRAQEAIELLKQQSKDPLLLGIWGMTGIGKSTIARAIYHQIGPYFEGKCMMEQLGAIQTRDPDVLQSRLLFEIFQAVRGTKTWKLPTVSNIEYLKTILKRKRILLILDDVDKLEQLHTLCGSREWFGEGSKIIITTRDRSLLHEHGVVQIYKVKELDESESLEVFNWKAFKQATSPKDFAELSRQVVAYSEGLPLALKQLGSYLFGKGVREWKGVLGSLERFSIPLLQLQESLEENFSDLSDKGKQMFLDIACFFSGKNQNDVLHTLNNNRSTQCTFPQISLLADKSLVTIDENNNLEVPILLQAMARDIIKRESSNKTHQPKMYDVFLSFRGEDVRAKFVSYLHSSLQNAGISTFKDDDEIQRGDQISFSLLKAIERSRISIVVLSTNYANSRWCMLELVKIMEIGRASGLVVVPVFYEVDPSEVRHQKGQFGDSFKELLSNISVDESTKSNWRRELYNICAIAGFVLVNSRDESADVTNIVEHVTRLLDRTELFVAEHPVGLESRAEAVIRLLNIQTSDVLIRAIWGMGGMGKTTIAKAIYNQIGRNFDRRSFIMNIRESWEKDKNLVSLQQQLLCDVDKTTTFRITNIDSGKSKLMEKLAQKRVLVVLDDVTEKDQLKALCGSRTWFGPGSRIIITTRNMDLLKSCEVDEVYTIEEMNKNESLELFSWHAFKQPSPTEDFATLATDVIAYSGRLPLALEVLGSCLYGCEITVWQKVLEKLKCIPNDEVYRKLKVSFDGLKGFAEKQIFLDIACFLIGMDRNDAILILNGCGFFADFGLKVLLERSLVTVDNGNKLRMHDLLRDMGRQIIYEESPSNPENRSRLWRSEEVIDMLSNDSNLKGAEVVEGLALKFPKANKVTLNTKVFKKMYKLRLLELVGVKLEGDFKHLSGNLRWLYWHGFPLTYIPGEFQQGNLVAIELKYSNLTQMWKTNKVLENLKILNLSHSQDLIETPDFSYMPNLEKIVLKDCPSLSAVSKSIGSLDKLLLLNLTDCTGLRKLPRSIYKLKSLETLILSGCSKIDKLEEDLEQMESLITFIADKTAITKVPFSIVRLKSIGYISLSGFEGFSRDVFPSLIRSWMSPSNNVISLVQASVFMSSLSVSKNLQKLRILCLECGSDLQLIQGIARFLDVLKATTCQNSEASASSTTSQDFDIYASPLIDDSVLQVRTSGSKNNLKFLINQMGTKCQVSNIVEDSVLQTADGAWGSFLLPCDNNSEWSTFSCNGSSIIFDIPTMKGRNLKSMMLFVDYYSFPENITSEGCQGLLIINYTKRNIQAYKRDTLYSFGQEDWQTITSNLEAGNKVKVMVVFSEGFIVDKTAVSLLYDETVNNQMERCHVIDEEDVIVSGNDDNNASGYDGNNEAINCFGEGTLDHMQITRHADGLYADVVGPIQLVPHYLDQTAEVVAAVAEDAAEAQHDLEHQVPPPEGEPEQQPTVAPQAIEPTVAAQILDAIRELRTDFARQERTVTARLNAIEVRLDGLEDVISQIPRGLNSESTDIES